MTVRIDVDLNSRGHDGSVRVSQRRADGELHEGDIVELYDPSDPGTDFTATIIELDERGRGLAIPDWVNTDEFAGHHGLSAFVALHEAGIADVLEAYSGAATSYELAASASWQQYGVVVSATSPVLRPRG